MALTQDARDSYTKIIDSILATSDLNTVSTKRIRKGLQDAVGEDLTPQKDVLKELIMQRFDIFAEQHETPASTNGTAPGNGVHSSAGTRSGSSPSPQKRSADTDHLSDTPEKAPPKKKRKDGGTINSDAVYAAKLQAEENLRTRSTRAGNTRKTPTKKKRTGGQTKGPKKISAEDDSDGVVSGSEPKKEVNRTGGFHKPLNLSAPLSVLLGETSLSRPQTVKKVWEYIRQNELQDPADKRHILCDDPMRAVFKQDRIHMFTMTKILSQNLYSIDE